MADQHNATGGAVTREELHHRVIDMRGFKRSDGLYEIEGHILDTKPVDFKAPNGDKFVPADTPLHKMSIKITFDWDMKVHAIEAGTYAGPYNPCFDAPPTLQVMVGKSMARGWSAEVRKLLSGEKCCAHLAHMLGPMAAAAYQSLTVERAAKPTSVDAEGRPNKINSCYAYGTDREVVLKMWPKFYTGTQKVELKTGA